VEHHEAKRTQSQHCSSYAGVEVQPQQKGWLRHQLWPDYFKPYYLPGQSEQDEKPRHLLEYFKDVKLLHLYIMVD
jgi:hypothetical protein